LQTPLVKSGKFFSRSWLWLEREHSKQNLADTRQTACIWLRARQATESHR
jgi:hypothetical protein